MWCNHSTAESDGVWREARTPSNFYTKQLPTMCDMVWVAPQTHSHLSVGVTPLMETGCTSASAWAEMVQNAPLAPGEVGTRHGNSWVIDDLGVSWKISLPSKLLIKFLITGLKQQLSKIDNSSLDTTHSACNLDFIFDEHLTFSDQISSLSKTYYSIE